MKGYRLRHTATGEYLFNGESFETQEVLHSRVNLVLGLRPLTIGFTGFVGGSGLEIVRKLKEGYEVMTFNNNHL